MEVRMRIHGPRDTRRWRQQGGEPSQWNSLRRRRQRPATAPPPRPRDAGLRLLGYGTYGIFGSNAVPRQPESALCIRAGYVALRRIADSFNLPYQRDPTHPEHPISVTRSEFEEALDRLEDARVPLISDRERAWRDFAGWRVNYDEPLLGLASLVMAPVAPWTSDRSPASGRPVPRFSAHRG